MSYLAGRAASVSDIASALDLAASTTALHIETLEEAGLIRTELEPASRGLRKICARAYDAIILELPVDEQPAPTHAIELSMPIGAFADCQAAADLRAGQQGRRHHRLAGRPGLVLRARRARCAADLVFARAISSTAFRTAAGGRPRRVAAAAAWRSALKAPLLALDWPSDITLWINGVEIGTWTIARRFRRRARVASRPSGGRPRNTQYGLLKVWRCPIERRRPRVVGIAHLGGTTMRDLRLERPALYLWCAWA